MKLKRLISSAAAAAVIAGALPVPSGTMAEDTAAVTTDDINNESSSGAPVAAPPKPSEVTTTAKAEATTTTAVTTTTAATTTTTVETTTTTTTTFEPAEQGKPVFHLTSTEVYLDDARHGKKQDILLYVSGAEGLYCDTLVYVYYDSRMTAGEAIAGEAVKALSTGQAQGDTKDFMVLTTSGGSDAGSDGVMWELSFILPEDCEAGDTFDIWIGQSKYGKIPPLFTNFAYDGKGDELTNYIFTNGLATGSITVIENPPYSLGDVNNDGAVNAIDATSALVEYASKASGKGSTFSDPRQSLAADADQNGAVNAVDASYILSYYAYAATTAQSKTDEFDVYMEKEKSKTSKQ